ncbi:hypothetical protein CUJ84_Chr005082 [Rhizobium leguminosarum]|uniref:Uncharacterized protein n=1 Tax=Rhizobium leguminosarum TaxID=384 RepID=A0A2K9ZBF1_RHILE|nr:hypothetical protein CUJ84_Chr005082 [Rhizobium leguminosarum]
MSIRWKQEGWHGLWDRFSQPLKSLWEGFVALASRALISWHPAHALVAAGRTNNKIE